MRVEKRQGQEEIYIARKAGPSVCIGISCVNAKAAVANAADESLITFSFPTDWIVFRVGFPPLFFNSLKLITQIMQILFLEFTHPPVFYLYLSLSLSHKLFKYAIVSDDST